MSKLLLRQGIVYSGGTTWTCQHEAWLNRQKIAAAPLQLAYDTSLEAMAAVLDRRTAWTGPSRNWRTTANTPRWSGRWSDCAGFPH